MPHWDPKPPGREFYENIMPESIGNANRVRTLLAEINSDIMWRQQVARNGDLKVSALVQVREWPQDLAEAFDIDLELAEEISDNTRNHIQAEIRERYLSEHHPHWLEEILEATVDDDEPTRSKEYDWQRKKMLATLEALNDHIQTVPSPAQFRIIDMLYEIAARHDDTSSLLPASLDNLSDEDRLLMATDQTVDYKVQSKMDFCDLPSPDAPLEEQIAYWISVFRDNAE